MSKRVLSVGQCGFDHAAISGLVRRLFGAAVEPCDTRSAALARLREQPYDLVLVNRQFDLDGDEGLELIRQIKQDQALTATPVMLVSNFADAQAEAMAAGAAPGFGKSAYDAPETRERLARFLDDSRLAAAMGVSAAPGG